MQYTSVNLGVSPSKKPTQLVVGAAGELLVAFGGLSSALNVSAAMVVKPSAGRVCKISVITAGSTLGAVYDYNSTASIPSGQQVAAVPNVVGVYTYDIPVSTGITIVPGTGQLLAVSYL